MVDRMRHAGKCAGFAAALYCASTAALAQTTGLADPTRPPGVSGQAQGVDETGAPAEVSGPRLQAIIVPVNGKPRALINGQEVVLGGKVGEARLVALSEKHVVLKGPAGIERLLLTPNVERMERVTKTIAMSKREDQG